MRLCALHALLPRVHLRIVSSLMIVLRNCDSLLTLFRQYVHTAERTACQIPCYVRGNTARWFGLSLKSSRRQGIELLLINSISGRRTKLLVSRIVHVHGLVVAASSLLVLVIRYLLLIGKMSAVVILLNVPMRIVNILLFILRGHLLLLFLRIRPQVWQLRVFQYLLIFLRLLSIFRFWGRDIGWRLDYRLRCRFRRYGQ